MAINLGQSVKTGKPVLLDEAHSQRHIYTLGTNGTGKTTLLLNLARQDIKAGRGLCVFDPHGDLIDAILSQVPEERSGDVVLLDARDAEFPFGINPLWCADPSNREVVDRRAAQFVELIEKLWGAEGSEGTSWGPRIPRLLRSLAITFLENPGYSMQEIPEFLNNQQFRNRLLANVTVPQVVRFWKAYDRLSERQREERTESTVNKLDEFLTQRVVGNIIGQSKTTVDFRKLMDAGRIVLCRLPVGALGEPVVELLGSLLVLELLNAALSRESIPPAERRPFTVYVDEFQRFATPAFSTLLTEARKFGLAIVLAHQVRGLLSPGIREATLNAGTLIIFAVHGKDAEELVRQFDWTPPESSLTRRVPILSISRDPVGHLTRNGHSDFCLQDIVRKWLRELSTEADHLPDSSWLTRSNRKNTYHVSRATLGQGRELLNSYLLDMMDGAIKPYSDGQSEAVLGILINLRAFFGIAQYESYDRFGRCDITGFSSEKTTPLFKLVRSIVCDDDMTSNLELISAAQTAAQRACLVAFGVHETQSAEETIYDLLLLGGTLARDPIRVDSGQWQEVPERRTFADYGNELISNFVGQPPFHAYARIAGADGPAEHELLTPRYEPLDVTAGAARAKAIQEQSRHSPYCQARLEVEAEIESRLSDDYKPRPTVRAVQLGEGQSQGPFNQARPPAEQDSLLPALRVPLLQSPEVPQESSTEPPEELISAREQSTLTLQGSPSLPPRALEGPSLEVFRLPAREPGPYIPGASYSSANREVDYMTATAPNIHNSHGVQIQGPAAFHRQVIEFLDELRAQLPVRYEEAIAALPSVRFEPELKVAGRSDGEFGPYALRTPLLFRHVYLHEIGHNIAAKVRGSWSEPAADAYVHAVWRELRGTRGRTVPEDDDVKETVLHVLEGYGLRDCQVKRVFHTDLGLPKAVVEVPGVGTLFVGSVGEDWPTSDVLEWMAPKVNAIADRLLNLCDDVRVLSYRQQPSGNYFWSKAGFQWFVRPFAEGDTLRSTDDSYLFAHALGMLHRASIELEPDIDEYRDTQQSALKHYVLPSLGAAAHAGLSHPLLEQTIEQLEWILENRAPHIDARPAILNHFDFQPKNLIRGRQGGLETVYILDSEQSSPAPRLQDLYFLLMGNDDGELLGDQLGFETRLRIYVESAGAISPEGQFLFPNILQCRAAGVAAWAATHYTDASIDRRSHFERYFGRALEGIEYIREHRDEIRGAARNVSQ